MQEGLQAAHQLSSRSLPELCSIHISTKSRVFGGVSTLKPYGRIGLWRRLAAAGKPGHPLLCFLAMPFLPAALYAGLDTLLPS